jgi:hypothetical protein
MAMRPSDNGASAGGGARIDAGLGGTAEVVTFADQQRQQEIEEAARQALRGTVYIIRAVDTNFVKVGFTQGDPRKRLRELQTGCPLRLEVEAAMPGTLEAEQFIHEMLTRFQVKAPGGNEWFCIGPELRGCDGVEAAEFALGLGEIWVKRQGGWDVVFETLRGRLLGG